MRKIVAIADSSSSGSGKALRIGKSLGDAAGRKRSASWKLAVALKLNRETPVTNPWLTDRLAMGVPNEVSAFCGLYPKGRAPCSYSAKLRKLNIATDPNGAKLRR